MKLFIANRGYFQKYLENGNFPENKVHQSAFNELNSNIEQGIIPIRLECFFGDELFLFNFVTLKNDVYFYEFETSLI